MKLESWEVICDKCNGDLYTNIGDEDYVTVCPKCIGTGKLDFIENITGKKITIWKPRSEGASNFAKLHIRRMITYINKEVSSIIHKYLDKNIALEIMKSTIDIQLNFMSQRKLLKDYKIDLEPVIYNNTHSILDITISPINFGDPIKISYTFQTKEQ